MAQKPSGSGSSGDRLDSWKAIANHLKRGVRTVRLWEKRESLPVHRHYHHRRSTVYAFRSELDLWLTERRPREPRFTPTSQRTLHVAPISGIGADAALTAFAAGLTEELITQLVLLSPERLIVAAQPKCAPRCQKRAIVSDFVLAGAVRAEGEHLRVTVRLTDARRNIQLWAEGYSVSAGTSIASQLLVVGSVAAQIRANLLSPEATTLLLSSAENAAHELCTQGRALCKKRTIQALRQAIDCFEQALDLQPACAPAYSGLADSYTLLGCYSSFLLPEAQVHAKRAAKRAIELDSGLGAAHASMGELKAFYEWDWGGGDAEFQRALALDSRAATAHLWYANLLSIVGRSREALAHGLRALALEPESPLIGTGVGLVHLYCQEPDVTVKLCQRALHIDPTYVLGHWALGLAYDRLGKPRRALRQFEAGKHCDPDTTYLNTSLAYAHASTGNQRFASSLLEGTAKDGTLKSFSSYDRAIIHAGLNEPDNALCCLNQACEERSDWIPYLAVEHRFDCLRGDTRYQSLLTAVGLGQNPAAI